MGFWSIEPGVEETESTLQEEYVGLNFRDTELPFSNIRPNDLFWTKKEIYYRI